MDSARSRQKMKDLNLCEKIVRTLSCDGPQKVLLIGESGIGKTRLAKKVSEHATKEGLCYMTLCLNLNNKFDNKDSLYENIAFQIEASDREKEEEMYHDWRYGDLKQKIQAELSRKKKSAEDKMKMLTKENAKKLAQGEKIHTSPGVTVPYLLLILDATGNKTSEHMVVKTLGLGDFLSWQKLSLKVIITRREKDVNTTESDNETESEDPEESQHTKIYEEIDSDDMEEPHDTEIPEDIESGNTGEAEITEVKDTEVDNTGEAEDKDFCNEDLDTIDYGGIKFHITDESQALLGTLTEDNLQDLFESIIGDKTRDLLESLQKAWKIDKPLISCVAQKCRSLPAAIVVLAKSLNCITHQNITLKQEKVLKEALSPCEPASSDSGSNPILRLAYELLETDDASKNAIVDCFWHSLDFFKHCGCANYTDLITQWILEGYFDPVRSVKKAYNDGYAILVELIDRGILKIQEGDMVVPEMAMNNLTDLRHHGFLGRSQLRFASVYGGDKKKGLGLICQIDDMIKTLELDRRERLRTFIVSGNYLRERLSINIFKEISDCGLQVLGLFSPTVESLIPSLKVLQDLRVLMIRDCDLLSDIEELKCLHKLNVLEVSGASSVQHISDDFFLTLPELQTLNLSGLRIISSPSSISQLKNLCSLILRDCRELEDFPDIHKLYKLEVVDVRGACKLKRCYGRGYNTSAEQFFPHLDQLQLIDFSESQIRRLPLFRETMVAAKPHSVPAKFHSLTRLSLRNCRNLIRLPNLKPLLGLQILDLSGTTSLVEIAEVCFKQKKKLKILNLSRTNFTKLPSTISGLSNLSQLLLRDSFNLEALPNIKGLTSLEVFDVSGCTMLHRIEGSFKDMSYLREVNLSRTRIETLPELPEKSSIFCSRLIVLADSKRLIHDTWSQVKEAITNGMYESLSCSDTVSKVQEITEKESSGMEKKQFSEPWVFGCPEKKGDRGEHLLKSNLYRFIFMNTIPFVDKRSYQEVLEIQGFTGVDQDQETLANAELVAFVDNSSTTLSSIFNKLKSVKCCWLEMCEDIQSLFSGVDEEPLGNLETLSITNLPYLYDIRSSSSFKNLKNLSLDCCPSIKTLFPGTEPPTSLEILKIKFCDKLERVFEEVEVPSLHTLCLLELPVLFAVGAWLPNLEKCEINKCPQLKSSKENLRRENVNLIL